ncbi:MAG: hypothetical protein R2830_22390 [Saprospiraceae bacterium]
MKIFLQKIALFSLCILVPLCLLEWWMRQPASSKMANKAVYLKEDIADCEALVLGCSHAQTSLNPQLFSQHGLNFSSDAQPYYYSYKFLETYLPRMDRLRTVIIPATYFFFFYKPEQVQEFLYSAHWGLLPQRALEIEDYSALFAHGIWASILNVFGEREHFVLENGWERAERVFDGSSENTKKRIGYLHDVMADSLLDQNIQWFNHLVKICLDHNIRLIVFLPPMSKEMNHQLETDIYRSQIQDYYATLRQNPAISFYDFNNNEIFADSLFCDPDHLNVQGANLLSNMMKDKLEIISGMSFPNQNQLF